MVVLIMSSIEFNAFSQKWKPTVRVCATKHLSKHLNKLYPIPSPKRYFLSIQVKSLSWARNFFFARTSHCVPLLPKQKAFPVALQNIFHETIKIPEITAIFMDPCSSRAILSASSINSIPKPWEPHTKKNTVHSQASTNSCQLSTTYLMLEFRWITSTDRNHTAVTMATRSRNKLISNCTIAPNLIGQKKIK